MSQDNRFTSWLRWPPWPGWLRQWSFAGAGGAFMSWGSRLFFSRWWLVLVLCSGAGLRLLGLGNDALWYDEVFSGTMARLTLPKMLEATAGDVHPPLWYLIEWISIRLIGDGAIGLRLPSTALGTYLIYECYSLMKRISGDAAGRASAMAVSILPAALNYSQEARMYSLLAVSVLGCLRAVLSNRWRTATALAIVAMYTHNLAALYMVPIGMIAIWCNWRRAAKMIIWSCAGYLPWALSALGQLQAVGSHFWPFTPTLGAVFEALIYNTLYIRAPGLLVLPMIIGVVVITAGALFVLRTSWLRLIPVFLMIALPPLILFLASTTWRSIWVQRALLPSGILLAAIWGTALTRLGGRDRLAALAIALPIWSTALGSYYVWRNPNDHDWRPSIQTIVERWRDCDVIYHIDVGSYMLMEQYAPGRNVLAPLSSDLSRGLSDRTKSAMGIVRAPFHKLTESYCRAWLVDARTPTFDFMQYEISTNIRRDYRILATFPTIRGELAELTIYLVDLSHAP